MNTTQLEYFISVARLRSFTKAAEKHFVSQTAITQQIQILEESLNVKLVDRSNRPISLTNEGRVFYKEASAIIERMNGAIAKVQTASSGISGTLNIAYLKGYERSDLSDKLRHFRKSYPNIFITATRCNCDDLSTGLATNKFDVIFTWAHAPLLSSDNVSCKVIDNPTLRVALYSGHPFAQRDTLTRADLCHESFIYYTPSGAFTSAAESYYMNLYKEAGFAPNIIFHSNDVESVLMMVAAEEGISILPSYVTDKLTDAKHLVFIPLTGEKENEEIVAVWRTINSKPQLPHFLENFNL